MSFNIVGDSIVQIPVVGESIAMYKSTEEVEFFMESIEGISLTKDGRFTVTTQVKPQLIKIYAVNNFGEKTQFHIQLIESWTINYVGQDGTIMKIPREDEVSTIGSPLYDFSRSEGTLWCIQGGFLLIAILFLLLYVTWKKSR